MNLNGIDINYIQYGNKKGKNIVLLHGWGQNIEIMDTIGKRLEKDFFITNIDLPGFGNSEEPKTPYTIYDYYEVLKELLEQLKITKPILIGHSFGGSVSIIYAAKESVEKLVLLASPFRRKNSKKTLKQKVFKTLKKLPLLNKFEEYAKNKLGSTDYKNASPMMRQVLVNVINEDITEYLIHISCPTLLIWGTADTATSIEDARYAESIMKDAGLVEYPGATHYAFLERLDQTISVLYSFFNPKK
jgi:pimeloyl-ACP methyl ester carboxylesterase